MGTHLDGTSKKSASLVFESKTLAQATVDICNGIELHSRRLRFKLETEGSITHKEMSNGIGSRRGASRIQATDAEKEEESSRAEPLELRVVDQYSTTNKGNNYDLPIKAKNEQVPVTKASAEPQSYPLVVNGSSPGEILSNSGGYVSG
jgi:hypothetical protein